MHEYVLKPYLGVCSWFLRARAPVARLSADLGYGSDDRMRFWINRQYEEGSDGRP
jgi:hypothetical protein